jgi:hypothetical protein
MIAFLIGLIILSSTTTHLCAALSKEVAERAALTCFQTEVELYEATKGRLPDADEADLIVDYCMRKYDETLKKMESKRD